MRRSYLPLPRGAEQLVAGGARGFDLEDRRGSAFLLQAARDFAGGCSHSDRQWLLQTGVPEAADGICRGSAEASGRESRRQRRLKQGVFTTETWRGRAANKTRNISRKGAKAAKKKRIVISTEGEIFLRSLAFVRDDRPCPSLCELGV